MSLEIEAKFKVDSLSELRERLLDLGAVSKGKFLQKEYYYEKGKLDFKNEQKALRVREKEGTVTLTFKHIISFEPVKKSEEYEFAVDKNIHAVLEGIGLYAELSYEKMRETMFLDKSRVTLDEVPLLGSFIEIESESREDIEKIRHDLSLKDSQFVAESYPRLFERDYNNNNRKFISFDQSRAAGPG